ncbi:MAG: tetratricopeptide repeat protein [Bacteroidetes bacterium]|nr:MAG: tetratricopeptide repeat protein [Bacteroidota bacterium]
MSECFLAGQQQQNKLTCITCHNPHVSVQITGKQQFNNSCNSCHQPAKQNQCKASPDKLATANHNCVQCHMPKSGTIDIPHVTVTDHWIRIPATKEKISQLKEFAGIYCINNPKSEGLTHGKAYLAYLEKFSGEKSAIDSATAYLKEPSQNNDEHVDALIHLWYLKQDNAQIIKKAASLKPLELNKPWLCYRIGRAYFNNRNYSLAEVWYKRAVELAPENLDFLNALGALYVETDDVKKAETTILLSLQKNPKQSEALTNLGFLHAKQQQFKEAIYNYDKAIALDPDFEQALLNKAAILIINNQKATAKNILTRVMQINPRNPMAKQLLLQLKP